jgi:tRNA nucleotidyltransferase/poly(A) polymerase
MNVVAAARTIVARLRENGFTAYFAGGCVRDQLLALPPTDVDVATDATPDQIRRLFRRTKLVGAQFGVALVRVRGCEIEVATFRTDGDYRDGRHPETVTFATPEADAARRDFTINGMFLDPLDGTLIDHVGGRADLANRVIRCIGEPSRRFAEDHLRLLRAVRFAARLGFTIEPATSAAMKQHAPRLAAISAERIHGELSLILGHRHRGAGWRLIGAHGLASHLIARFDWSAEQFARCAAVLEALPAEVSPALALAAIFIGRDAEALPVALRKLRTSVALSKAVIYVVSAADEAVTRPDWELADVKNLVAGGHGSDVLALARARLTAEGGDARAVDDLARRVAAVAPADAHPEPLVTGEDLIALQLPPGPRFREILDAVYRRQLNEVVTTRAQALACARKLAELN